MELLGLRIKTLRVRNLQSMRDFTVSFDRKGVFKLDGNNNIGKSALTEAIRILAKNVPNNQYKFYLRDGCDHFIIDYVGWDDAKVTLSRGSVDFYEWELADGTRGRSDKTSGKVPTELEKYFNLYHEKEKTNQVLNLRMKDDVIPFVGMTPGDNNFVLQKALGTEDYLLGLKAVQKTKSESAKEVKLLDVQLEQETERLQEVTARLTKKKRSLAEVERYEAVLIGEYAILEAVEDVQQAREGLAKETERLENLKSRVSDLPVAEGERLFELLGDIQGLQEARKQLVALEHEYTWKKERLQGLETEEGAEAIALLEDIRELQQAKENLLNLMKELETLRVRLSGVEDAEEAEKLLVLLGDIQELQDNKKHLHVLEGQFTQAQAKKKQAEQELEQLKNEMGVCPLCGIDIHQEHVHQAV